MNALSTNQSASLKHEIRSMLRLAWPLVLAELGWMVMGIVDTMMVGRVSAAAIAGVSVGSILFYTMAVFGSGLLLGLDTLVSQAYGAGKLEECHRSLWASVWLCLFLSPLLWALVRLGPPALRAFAIHPAILHEAIPYLKALDWSMLPLLFYFAFRRYLQAMNRVRPVMFALVTANLVNIVGNWALIYGHLGAPPMGAVGSAWSTCMARLYMAAILLACILYFEFRESPGLLKTPARLERRRLRKLLALGVPAATQYSAEVAVFAIATALIGKLGPVVAAGHQIALLVVSFTYMVPLGIASAAAVRVGQAAGREDRLGIAHSGAAAFILGCGFMSCAAIVLLLAPRYIVRAFTADGAVVTTGASLLLVAAFFQLFDGLQTVATGALRGLGDTRTPMLCHLLGYWLIGLPIGYFLCYARGWGAVGLWTGLCVALILIGVVLLQAWRWRVRALAASPVYT